MMGMKIMAMGAAKDTEMKETQINGGNIISDASVGNAGNSSINGKEVNAPEA
jgi:hypothetical protein